MVLQCLAMGIHPVSSGKIAIRLASSVFCIVTLIAEIAVAHVQLFDFRNRGLLPLILHLMVASRPAQDYKYD